MLLFYIISCNPEFCYIYNEILELCCEDIVLPFSFSLSELEDVLSCDDEVLNDVYQYHTPPLRRLPPLLWVRIQDDLDDYLVSSGADGIQVIRWYHRQFHTVASDRYLSNDIQR